MNLQLTDPSLFGEVVTTTAVPPCGHHSKPAKCKRCGARERIKTIGKLITTTLSPVLGICGRCVSKEAGL
jgi:hypothetical protein